MKSSLAFFLLSVGSVGAYTVPNSPVKISNNINNKHELSRRSIFQSAIVAAAGTTAMFGPTAAFASGGATAGKYTTIPIAKRRYYGRVQAAVRDFLLMGGAVVAGDMTAPIIQDFFDENGLVVVEAKRKDINGQCTKKNYDCKGAEIRDSKYNDMKTSMYLLGNAFRINQQKAPDNLPTVQAAKAFFKEIDSMEKRVQKAAKKAGKNAEAASAKDTVAIGHYAAALDILEVYLDLVELPPTDSGNYEREFSRSTGDAARIT